MSFLPSQIIQKKRDGFFLKKKELEFFVRGFVSGSIPDYQMSAFLMSIFFRGMNPEEMTILVKIMRDSGMTLKLKKIAGYKVDKHSTGGVGDKISLILAPLLACMGLCVPMISGRGLGHSGGTLDKLEAIPGLKTRISVDKFKAILKKVGFVIAGQTEEIVPADRKMYALRDATSTIESLPLVVASIMSKKLAEDLDGLVLDVKTGKGAFFSNKTKAMELAGNLITVGENFGIKVRALLTNMDQPIGYACGNWLEVVETINCLQDEGPADTMAEVYSLGVLALKMSGSEKNSEAIKADLQGAISDGRALEKFIHYVELMGGDTSRLEKLDKISLPKPVLVRALKTGNVAEIDARQIGIASMVAGAGRTYAEEEIDHDAGIKLHVKIGDPISKNDLIAEIYSNKNYLENVVVRVQQAIKVIKRRPEKYDLIFGEVNNQGQLFPADIPIVP